MQDAASNSGPPQPPAEPPKPSPRTTIIVVFAIIVVALLSALARRDGGPKVREISGTVTAVDPISGRAEAEVLHPRNGQKIPVSGTVTDKCAITINGRPAKLADVRVGDEFEAEGTVDGDRKLSANWIHITRGGESPPTANATGGRYSGARPAGDGSSGGHPSAATQPAGKSP